MSKEADGKPKDLTNRLIIENIKVISQDMRLIKQSLLKLMNDVNYAITQGDVVSQILEESQIAGKDEIKTVVDLLKQAYMEEDWKIVLECVEILQKEEEVYHQDENFDETDF